jgi:hypothetical protein
MPGSDSRRLQPSTSVAGSISQNLRFPGQYSDAGSFASRGPANPTFALERRFLSARQKIPFAFNVGTAKIGEN